MPSPRSVTVIVCLLGVWHSFFQVAASNAAEQKASAGTGTIVVRVVDDTGTPRADVPVRILTRNLDWQYWEHSIPEARTDNRGIARFERLTTDAFYLVRATTADGLLGYRGCSVVGENARQAESSAEDRAI